MTLSREQRILRYGGRAPRYTSYPTANHFHDLDADVAVEQLRSLEGPVSAYVHVPYCQRLCWYCGCNTTIRRDRSIGAPFVDLLLAEVDRVTELTGDLRLEHLALGGGTPNYLRTDDLRALVQGLEQRIRPADGVIRSTEIDPRTVETEQLDLLTDLGFQRFSLGVQTLDLEVQQAVNRPFDPEILAEMVHRLRRLGARSINFDLMVGLPRQTEASVDRTLQTVSQLAPERLAVFQYAHMPQIRPAQKLLARHGLPDADERDSLFRHVVRRLVSLGYVRVGFDHFARADDALAVAWREGTLKRNFQGFTTDQATDLLGFGPSAIGRVGDLYVQNHRDLKGWTEAIEAGRLPVVRGVRCTDEDLRVGRAIEDLMCGRPVDLDLLGPEADTIRERLQPLEADGLVQTEAKLVRLTDAGFDFSRAVAAAFDRRLDRSRHAAVV